MNRMERISQICLYMGALLLVLFMDWHWYARRYPFGNALLKAEFFPVIYIAYVVAIIGCFGTAAYFNLKSMPKRTGHKDKRKTRQKKK